jgi:DNA mismatch endonuclease (patch repair protein)
MPDVFTKRKRSEVMSRIRGRGNKETELALAKLLRKHRITGWRRNQAVFGKPDFVFRRQRLAVFVDGCFWHGCPIHSNPARWLKKSSMKDASTSCSSRPEFTPIPGRGGESPSARTGRAFWTNKMKANIARDRVVNRTLRQARWTIVRIWEHDLTNKPERSIQRIRQVLIPSTGRYQ